MNNNIKKIGVLTSGGDAPGMNAAIRAITRTALAKGIKVVGIKRGYQGLIEGDFVELGYTSVSRIINRGGTFLYSARCDEFRYEAGIKKAVDMCRKNGIDGVVAIGGDGTFRGAADLSAMGIPCIGVPGTIDNDISISEYTIGFDTAVNCVIDMVDRLRDTMESHQRCSVVEVMGRHAGYIALYSAISTGATAVAIPEVEFKYEDILAKIKDSQAAGKTHFIVIVAEGIGNSEEIAARIEEDTGIITRATVLGHVQRGGAPTADDRVNATKIGHYAVELIANGYSNKVCGIQKGELVNFDVQEALKIKKPFPIELYKIFLETSK
jgi:6-phosphofructokinase 1